MDSPSIAVVTCYRHPDYIRAITLRRAVHDSGLFGQIHVVKNSSRGIIRYAQVALQLLRLAVRSRPDAYLVTFRGYEILPFVLLLAGRRPVYYDEFINPVEWFVHEHSRFVAGSLRGRFLRRVYRLLLTRTQRILADTASHALHSAYLMKLPTDRYATVPVGNDDQTFRPVAHYRSGQDLRILYYGSMLPLHGLPIVLDAMIRLNDLSHVTLVVVGGDSRTRQLVARAEERGASIEYRPWVDYQHLPDLFASCDLMLGGPFGGTVQSKFVVTGKTFQFLACALPVVVGRNCESGIFSDRENSIVVSQDDPVALEDALRWCEKNKLQLPAIGLAGRELYEETFSARAIAEALASALGKGPLQVEDAGKGEEQSKEDHIEGTVD